jgi:hypothetical protein
MRLGSKIFTSSGQTTSAGGIGRTTAKMRIEANFTGSDNSQRFPTPGSRFVASPQIKCRG